MTAWGPIGREVYERTYSRVREDGSRETWGDTVTRVVDGNLALAPKYTQLPGERSTLIDMFMNFKMLPAGRHLWVSGVEGRQFLFNCHRAGWDRGPVAHCEFLFDALMVGGGVGSDYTNAPDTVPLLTQIDFYEGAEDAFVVEDSREGWVKALEHLLRSQLYGDGRALVTFNLSHIREPGEPLKTFGGVSSGAEPLKLMLAQVCEKLNIKARHDERMGPIDWMEVDHLIASCVIAGNVRRSARMSILNWEHPHIYKFLGCKQQDGQHWTTNISVGIDDEFWEAVAAGNPHATMVLDAIAKGMADNGEPGIFNQSRAQEGERGDVSSTNPCGEIALEEWEPCNLGHLNLALLEGEEARELAATLMARFLVRATCTPDVHCYQRGVLERNRRIGVGLYGVHEWFMQMGLRYSDIAMERNAYYKLSVKLRSLYDTVRRAADKLSDELGIPRPIKCTTIAPTGTISLLSGHTAGAHPVAAKQFIRRVRYSNNDPALESFPASMVEPDVYSANTSVVSMLCEDPVVSQYGDLVEDAYDLKVSEQLHVQQLLQYGWADNAVSYTVALPQGAGADLVRARLVAYGQRLKGMTMFPQLSRAQQPIERLSEEEYQRLSAIMRAETSQAEVECINGACPVK